MEKLTHTLLDKREAMILRRLGTVRASLNTTAETWRSARAQAAAEFVEIDRYRKTLLDKAKT